MGNSRYLLISSSVWALKYECTRSSMCAMTLWNTFYAFNLLNKTTNWVWICFAKRALTRPHSEPYGNYNFPSYYVAGHGGAIISCTEYTQFN